MKIFWRIFMRQISLTDYFCKGLGFVTMEKDLRRMLLFFKREAYVVILERDRV
ncbi:hypothetical protein NM3158_1330 [Neisseria meningitidis NM3158]|nr:hypothetical protein NM3158_1330 [Neisseria meningitidis NM3158]